MEKLTYSEFIALDKVKKDLTTQLASFKHNPIKVLNYVFNENLNSCISVVEMKSDNENIKAWIINYKENRPRYIIIASLPNWNIEVTDETQLDILDSESTIHEA